jgi:hypothetical protein
MTTKLTKAVYRETDGKVPGRGREYRHLICGMGPGDILTFRLKGTRKSFSCTIEGAYHWACKLWAQQERARKLAERKAKRGG